MKKLGELGRGSKHVTKMEYKNTVATSESAVADLMAQYVEDSFQPLQEPDFDYALFNRIEREWNNSQTSLNNSIPVSNPPNVTRTVEDLNHFNITWPSPFLRNQDFQDHISIRQHCKPDKTPTCLIPTS